MWYRRLPIYVFTVCWLLGGAFVAWAQPASSRATVVAPQELDGPLQADTVAARKSAVQTRLEALGKSSLPKEDLEATQTSLEQLLKVLTALEEGLQRRATFTAYLDGLPQRVRDLEAQRKTLESPDTPQFPKVTAELQVEYEGRLQSLQNEIQELIKQTAAGEVRAAAIAKELEQRVQDRSQLEKELLETRSEAAKTGEQTLQALRVELLDWKDKLQQVEVEALTVEREWLAKRAPLQDAMQSMTQMRLHQVTKDVERIKQELHTVLVQKQATLSSQVTHLEQQLEQTADPTAALRLAVTLETVAIRKQTAEYQQQRTRLGDVLRTQENQNAQTKSNADRLASLVGKHASGEGVAQRLWRAFERLQRERTRYHSAPLKDFETRLRILTAHILALDDRLYDFDNTAETRLAKVRTEVQSLVRVPSALSPPQRDAIPGEVHTALEEQKTALREQQQALTVLEQDLVKIVALHRESKRLLDESYLFVLSKMFWLRDAAPLTSDVGPEVMPGVRAIVQIFQAFVTQEQVHLQTVLSHTVSSWLLLGLTFFGLPWIAYKTTRYLRAMTTSTLLTSQTRLEAPPLGIAFGLMLQSAIWPAYLLFLGGIRLWLLPANVDYADVLTACIRALQTSALILWISGTCWGLFQPHGWGQAFWGLPTALRVLLRYTLGSGCIAALVFLVPHRFLLSVSGDIEMAASSMALARLLFLAFQCVILVLLGILGRRSSALMSAVLHRSHQHNGLLWRIWPLLYLLLLVGSAMILAVDVLGYRYAARFIWLRVIESLGVVLGMRLVVIPLGMQVIRRLSKPIFSIGSRLSHHEHRPVLPPPAQPFWPIIRLTCHVLVWLLTAAIVLELWGVSVSWLFSSSAGADFLTRLITVLLAIGSIVVVIKFSETVTEYMLQPRLTRGGAPYEAGRKLKTLAPLFQASLRISAMFMVVIVFLEQVGFDTGPLLTGVGFLGLGVGFAAQSLLKDVINGLFFLFEDSLSVGDIVTLRGVGGQVEKVTLRSVTLRDLEGKVHVIPNGTIDTVTNMTKDYAYSVLDVGIAYDVDIDVVVALLRQIDEAIRNDPAYNRDILEPLDIMGLEQFTESAMIIRARVKTRPMQQWRVGRELKRRMKKIFDENGIEIPFPQRVLHWRMPKNGDTAAVSDATNAAPVLPQDHR